MNAHIDRQSAPKTEYDVIVIGGGASGMMVAGRAAVMGKRVLLLEKNAQLGEKLKITGGGRCNITNAEFDTRALLANYGAAEQFLYSPFAQFGVQDTIDFFTERGLPIVVQARKRAFPSTEKALDVFRVMERYLSEQPGNKVNVIAGAKVSEIRSVSTAADVPSKASADLLASVRAITGVVANGRLYTAQSYVIATGGQSHPETGSTGDGFVWLKKLGHTVIAPTPTIVPLAIAEQWVKELSGVSLSFMKITFCVDGKKAFSKTGKILFTHFGVSGPLILNSAAKVAALLRTGPVTARIDAYPDTDEGALEQKIIAIFDANKNKMLKNIFDQLVPEGTAKALLPLLAAIDPDTKVHSVTKEQRKMIVRLLKALPLTVIGLMGFDRAVVADGGVPLSEIDMKTMRSLRCENLFVTGDLLHVSRPSGGFSLQLCWTTGFIAGSNA